MAAIWMRARAELRAHARTWIALAVLLGLMGGVALTAAAGARRTSSSFDRFLATSRSHDVIVQVNDDSDPAVMDRLRALPMVTDAARQLHLPSDDTVGTDAFAWDLSAIVLPEAQFMIPRLVQGRRPDDSDPVEAMISPDFARIRGVGIGDEFSFQTVTFPELFLAFDGGAPRPTGPAFTVRIVGVWTLPLDVGFTDDNGGFLYLTPAFARRLRSTSAAAFDLMAVRLERGLADTERFTKAARRAVAPARLGFDTRQQLSDDVDRALDVQSVALWAFAGIVGVAALLTLGQAAARSMWVAADDHPALRAMGVRPGGLVVASLLPPILVAVTGAVLAAAAAVFASPVMPVGLARRLEPDPGIAVDTTALGLGAAVLALAFVARAGVAAVLLARRTLDAGPGVSTRRSRIADALARAGSPVPAVAGARFAVEPGSGRSAVPVRSALAGVSLAALALASAFTFAGGFDRMLATPSVYGWNWDVVVFGGEDERLARDVRERLVRHELVAELTEIRVVETDLQDGDLEVAITDAISGSVGLRVLEGRAPAAADEIAFASRTLRRLGRRIGDSITLEGNARTCGGEAGCPVPFRIVGRIVFWSESAPPGSGASITRAGEERIRRANGFIDYLIRLAPGAPSPEEAARRLSDDFEDATAPQLSAELLNVRRVSGTPDALGLLLGVLAVAVLAHVLLTGVRRRARDLAVLKVLGCVRRQVRATVAWQASLLMLVGLAVGIPSGVVAGRWAWRSVATLLGVVPEPVTPAATLGIVAGGALVLANALAMLPARAAARTRPAVVLRAE